jgi:hypothetical protein
MDDIVRRGLAKWPNVPAVYGWLSLNRRGQWLIKGSRISNPLVAEFIGRNYARDARGCWYFQNGPQRVFVDLEYAPFVLRATSPEGAPLALATHTARQVAGVAGAWLDEDGTLVLGTAEGPGTIHDGDLERLLPSLVGADGNPLAEGALDEALELAQRGQPASLWLKYRGAATRVDVIAAADVPHRLGFVARPVPPAGEEVCT